jgi:hypothetical protein
MPHLLSWYDWLHLHLLHHLPLQYFPDNYIHLPDLYNANINCISDREENILRHVHSSKSLYIHTRLRNDAASIDDIWRRWPDDRSKWWIEMDLEESVYGLFDVLSGHLLERLREASKNFSQDSVSQSRFEPTTLEFKPTALRLGQPVRWFIYWSYRGLKMNIISVVGWGTMLQAGRSRVWVPMRCIFFNWPNPSSRTMALGSTQPLPEMSTRNLPGG